MEELKDLMKTKFASSNYNGINIAFKFNDGAKTEYCFSDKATVKVII